MAANGDKMHRKNNTRYVELNCTEIHRHSSRLKKIVLGLGAHAPSPPMDLPLIYYISYNNADLKLNQ